MSKKKPRLAPREDEDDFDYGSPVDEEDDDAAPPRGSSRDEELDNFGIDEPTGRTQRRVEVVDEDDEEDEDETPASEKKAKAKAVTQRPKKKRVPGTAPKARTVSFDDRKLTKSDKARLSDWNGSGKQRDRARDLFFKGQVARAREKFGHKAVMLGSESDNLIVTIPMYGGHGPNAAKYPGCLPMEFVMAQSGFPLGLVIQLVAETGVGKSGLLAEFYRWFDLAGGGGELKENETKFNPDWYRSFMGEAAYGRLELIKCKSVEDWQRKLTFGLNNVKLDMEGSHKKPGPGRTIPVLFGVDSIMGKPSEEVSEAIFGAKAVAGRKGKKAKRAKPGTGNAERGHPVAALKIATYMRAIPDKLDEWPFSLVLVNHLRNRKDDDGNPTRIKGGGDQVGFQESFELELRKVGGHKKKIECLDFEGFPVQISCEKNSFGPTHRRIQTRILWWDVPGEEGSWQQQSIWDWDWSTVHLLHSINSGDRASPRLKACLAEANFHLECPKTGEIDNSAWSKNLGMKVKDAVTWSELGAMIREDAVVMASLRNALRINVRPLLAGDYLKQLDQIAEDLR